MYGWRGRIGHICPSIPIDMIINEFQQIIPDGVVMVYTSLHVQNIRQEDFDRALDRLTEATEQMAEGEVDCIIAGGGPLVALRGTDADIVEHITGIANVPASTTTGAMISALRHLEAKRIVIASPYSEERNKLLGKYLESPGLHSRRSEGPGPDPSDGHRQAPVERLLSACPGSRRRRAGRRCHIHPLRPVPRHRQHRHNRAGRGHPRGHQRPGHDVVGAGVHRHR